MRDAPTTPVPPQIRTVSGIESLREIVEGGGLDHVQLEPGPMTAEMGHFPVGGLVFGYGRVDKALRSQGAYNPVGYNIGVLLEVPRPCQIWAEPGLRGSAVVGQPGAECDSVVPGEFSFAYLIAPPALWSETVTALVPERAEALLRGREVVRPVHDGGEALARRFEHVLAEVAERPDLLGDPAAQVALQEDLLGAMASAAGSAEEVVPVGRFFAHRRLVLRAEEIIAGRGGEPVYIRELCEACDVSERTLHYAFREILGLTPMQYLTRRRLSAVRLDLSAAGPASGVVARTAARWGFWHLGHFARAYRALFGETPSDTVRRGRP